MSSRLRYWLLVVALGCPTVSSMFVVDVQPYRSRPARFGDPRDAPPPLRAERVGRRRGFVWISGEWEWSGRWRWKSGHWEAARAGRKFTSARWEHRGDVYIHVDGRWDDVGAPPPLREERFDPRRGQTFVRGHWEWDADDSNWDWVPGHFERERQGRRWREERWENRNGEWVLVNGGWEEAPTSAFPTSAPPAGRVENPGYRNGHVWSAGHWDWENGQWDWEPGRWEVERSGFTLRPGHWDQRNGRWEWTAPGWDAAPSQYPTSAPPGLRPENPGYRQDSVWSPGHWDWRNGQWDWLPGHWETTRVGFTFHAGRWEQRSGRWEWIGDRWDPAPVSPYPTSAPPALRPESVGYRQGSVWSPGHWDWRNGAWDWVAGHWENERPGFAFHAGRWEQRNSRWEWIADSWDQVASPYPTSAPPPGRSETPGYRDGFIWDPGHWQWTNGQWDWLAGHWEQARPNMVWRPGRWENHASRWQWQPGAWENAPNSYNGPRSGPPASREENPGYRDGFVWAHGHYQWLNGAYDWVPGHWERERSYKRWIDARWDQRGNEWFLTDGHWE